MNIPANHAAAIVALAIALTVPALLSPQMTHDSFWIDWVWADQFTAELAKGNFYPRWLPLSHGGLGSPVFYYYPPLAFYACALFGLAGFSTYWSIVAVFCCGFARPGSRCTHGFARRRNRRCWAPCCSWRCPITCSTSTGAGRLPSSPLSR